MAIEIDEPTLFENVLHYGLLLGAIFQLICIFAVIFIPKSDIDKDEEEEIKSTSTSQPQPSSHQQSSSSRKSKKEKKKNR